MDGGDVMGMPSVLQAEVSRRLRNAPQPRLAAIMSDLLPALCDLVARHRISRADLKAAIGFLSEVETTCSENRQEWILLADAMGLSAAIEQAATPRPKGATPNTILGPFYRAGAPVLTSGASIDQTGTGTPLALTLRVVDLDGEPVPEARIDVWQANADGRFENQEPHDQPDMNLRGQFTSDAAGQVVVRTVRPGGYALPGSGPVAHLMQRLGLGRQRPAHIQFRVRAAGFMTLTTHVFDRHDPAIDADPLFCVRPDLLADLRGPAAQITFTLARARPGAEDT